MQPSPMSEKHQTMMLLLNIVAEVKEMEITPEQQVIVDQLTQSNQDEQQGKANFPQDDTFQRILLSAILKCPVIGPSAVKFVKADYFSNEAHKIAMGIVSDFYDTHNEMPEQKALLHLLSTELEERDAAVKLHFMSEIVSLYDYDYYSKYSTSKIFLDEACEWAKNQTMKVAFIKGAGNSKTMAKELSAALAAIELYDGNTKVTESMADVRAIALTEKVEWVIPGWLEFGAIGMFTGDPFSGKSCLATEIFTSIGLTGKFARYDNIPKCAILLFDAENRRSKFVQRLNRALEKGNEAALDNLLIRVDCSKITLPMTNEDAPGKLRELIQQTKIETGQDKCFVVIDTMRSVFKANEMDNEEMKGLIYPLQRVAQEENAAILILHHRTKGGAAYGGVTAIAGAMDYHWMWESDKSTGLATLSLEGTRDDYQRPIRFCLKDFKNVWLGDSATGAESMSQKKNCIPELLESALKNGPKNQSALILELQNLWKVEHPGEKPIGKDNLRELIVSYEGSIVIGTPGPNNSKVYKLMGGQ